MIKRLNQIFVFLDCSYLAVRETGTQWTARERVKHIITVLLFTNVYYAYNAATDASAPPPITVTGRRRRRRRLCALRSSVGRLRRGRVARCLFWLQRAPHTERSEYTVCVYFLFLFYDFQYYLFPRRHTGIALGGIFGRARRPVLFGCDPRCNSITYLLHVRLQ